MEDLQHTARSMQDQGEWGAAALAVNDAILQADPEDAAATVRRARCLRARGRLEESLSTLEALVEKSPENPVAKSQAAKTRRRLEVRNRAARLLGEDPSKLFDALERAKHEEREHEFQIEDRLYPRESAARALRSRR